METKTITKDNYREIKPSQFIRSFKTDLEQADKPLDLSAWDIKDAHRGCLPCLGGLKCLNLDLPVYGTDYDKTGSYVGNLGDGIRRNSPPSVTLAIDRLFGIGDQEISYFENNNKRIAAEIATPEAIIKLLAMIDHYADEFEKLGY